jgi:hypothetical protein
MFGRSTVSIEFRQVEDGLANTFMVGETIPSHWRHNSLFCNNFPLGTTHIPLNSLNEFDDMTLQNPPIFYRSSGYKSYHPAGAHMLMGDASVHFVSENIDYYVYNELGTTSGGEDGGRLP